MRRFDLLARWGDEPFHESPSNAIPVVAIPVVAAHVGGAIPAADTSGVWTADTALLLVIPIAMVGWQWGTWPAVVAAIVSVAVLAAQQLTTQDGLGAVGYLTRAAVFGTVAFLAGALAGRRQNIRLPLNPSAVVLEPSTHPPVDLTTPDPADVLTQRELEVLGMMAVGSTNAEIAERLVISQSTVKSHVKSILRKLGVRNRTEAVSRFLRR